MVNREQKEHLKTVLEFDENYLQAPKEKHVPAVLNRRPRGNILQKILTIM